MKEQRKNSLILQVSILFAIGALLTGVIVYFSQFALSDASVKRQTETLAAEIADETLRSFKEYPAHEWLLRYWYRHADEMEIEYDVDYGAGTETEKKSLLLSERYPGLQLKYATAEDVQAMSVEDRRLYAEVVYSWLITRVNQIKRAYHVDYLFCVLTDETYKTQFFMFSAAEENSVRGTNYEEVYPLGTLIEVGESQQNAMRFARLYSGHLADAGNYVDYYSFLAEVDDHPVFLGLTYNLTSIRNTIRSETQNGTGRAMLYQIALSSICLLMIYAFVLRPLKKIQKNIRLYRQTKDSETVVKNLEKIRPHNEIGELSADVSDLAGEIDLYLDNIRTITAEKERLGVEMTLATRIQAAMLPSVFPPYPHRSEFDLYASMDPAREVGGDFYDFFLIDDDHLCLVIADVSGKGVPAALFMMVSKIVIQNYAQMGKSPAQILMDTNKAICAHNPEEMFVTVWMGILETSTGKLTAANAGHEYPALRRADGVFELVKDRHGLVIGGMNSAIYKEYELFLEPGAKLFVYTDGVPEATDTEMRMLGKERMLAALNEEPGAAPEQILKNMRRAVDNFVNGAEQFDDLTMLCVEYKGMSGGEKHGE